MLSATATMNVPQDQIAEMMFNMHKQCEFFAASVNYNEKDDTSYASWGSMLMHLSMVHEQQDEKKKYLKQAIEKLQRALEINPDSHTHEGELAVFSLGNAYYFEFFLEKNDSKAEASLKKAKVQFEDSMKREPGNLAYRQMLEQLDSAHEQRKAAHEHLDRLEGKSEEERKIEIRAMQTQMLVSVVDSNRKAVEADPTNAAALSELAKSLFELSMLQMRDEARATLKEGLDACQKSIAINPSESAVTWVRGVLQQAYSMVVPDASLAATLKADAQADFSKVLNAEKDSKKRDTLVKEKELLSGTMDAWMQNINAVEAESGVPAVRAAPAKKAQRSAPPPAGPAPAGAAAAGKTPGDADSSGVTLAVATVVIVGVAAAVWYFRKRE